MTSPSMDETGEPDLVIQPEQPEPEVITPLIPPVVEEPVVVEPVAQSVDIAWEVLDVLTS